MFGKQKAASALVVALVLVASTLARKCHADWLVQPVTQAVTVERGTDGKDLVLGNGLIRRTFRLQPNVATIGYDNLMTGASLLRGVKPEATIAIDGRSFAVGGLLGQVEYAYLRPEWVDTFTNDPNAFQFVDYETGGTKARFPWKRKRYSADLPWPPPGASLRLRFEPPAGVLPGVAVTVCYEMYRGIPLLAKWLEIHNGGTHAIRLNTFTSEVLAAVEAESLVNEPNHWELPNLHVNSQLPTKGLAMIYNPLDRPVRREVKLPLYYTGLTATARIREQEGEPRRYRLDRRYDVTVPVSIRAHGRTWLLID